jgi:ribulose-5-phosphate 4-epimerase/fuculose-1-phosphate aldolase
MSDASLREALCRVGRSLHARGYVHGTTGNLSARLAEGFLITATDACLGELDPAALVKVDAEGRPFEPDARPSKTLALHRRIYAVEPEAGCVIHTHSSHLVRATLDLPFGEARDDLLPPITPYFVMKVGHVPVLAYRRPGDPAVADDVAAAIASARARGAPIRAVMLARLGPNVWHATPDAAMAVLEELEETARLWLAAEPKPVPLAPAHLDELRRHFGARW